MMEAMHNMNPNGRGFRVPMPSGIYVYPEDPRPEEFRIYDVAHKLAFQCRYGGGVTHFYSIAEHCVLGTEKIEHKFKLDFLLHDRAEAWLQDFMRPLKMKAQPWYGELERRVERVSAPVWGIKDPMPGEVVTLDYRLCIDEKQQLYRPEFTTENHLEEGEPVGITCACMDPYEARDVFLETYGYLTGDYSWKEHWISPRRF